MSTDSPARSPGHQSWMLQDRVCDRFEAAWREGNRPSIETFLAEGHGPDRGDLLSELVTIEIEYRRRLGETPTREEYRVRFPELAEQTRVLFRLNDPAHQTLDASGQWPVTQGPGEGPVPQPAIPSIPGYEMLGELGRGGMGVVYLAQNTRLGRLCALKMISAGELANPEIAARFLAEATTVARLRHPHIVQIYHIGDHANRPYFELEHVEGGSLASRLDGTPWSATDAARLIETLSIAMQEAHRIGIVHRDLKPGNILMTAEGNPKIADFGLAKLLGGGSDLTRTEWILGTPSYMSPEQAWGHAREVGPSCDVYALGAILYELLTGRPPFKGANVFETVEQVKSIEPVAPSRLQPGLPRDLETICLSCLQKEPSRRYETAGALADDLRRYLNGEPIEARRSRWIEQAWKWCRRNPAVARLTTLSLLLSVAIIVGASGAALAWLRAIDQASAAEKTASLQLRETYVAQARTLRWNGRPGRPVRRVIASGQGCSDPPRCRSPRRGDRLHGTGRPAGRTTNGPSRCRSLAGHRPTQVSLGTASAMPSATCTSEPWTTIDSCGSCPASANGAE